MTDKKNDHNKEIDLTPEYYDGEYWWTKTQVREMERLGNMKEILDKYARKEKADDK